MSGSSMSAKDPLGAAGLWPGASLGRRQLPPSAHTLWPTPCPALAHSALRNWVAATHSRAQPYAWRACPVSQPSSAQHRQPPAAQWTQRAGAPSAPDTGQPTFPSPRGQPEASWDAGGGRTGFGRLGPGTVQGEGGVTLGDGGEPR